MRSQIIQLSVIQRLTSCSKGSTDQVSIVWLNIIPSQQTQLTKCRYWVIYEHE